LIDWVDYVLEICQDQVAFMSGMFRLGNVERGIAACLVHEEQVRRSGVRLAALRPLHYLFVTAGSLLRALLERRLLASDTPREPVQHRIALLEKLGLDPLPDRRTGLANSRRE